MKKFFTLFAFLAFGSLAQAQMCMPDSSVIDAPFPVQPLPYDAATGMGGIPDTVCLDEYFEFAFQAAVGDTFALGGALVPMDSIRLATSGAVGNLPNGISYSCNPGDCVFKKNTLGCILLYGTVTDPTFVGNHSLTISVEVYLNGASAGLPVSLPIPTVTPGEYILAVREPDAQTCRSSSTDDLLEEAVSVKNVPNPFSGQTVVEANSQMNTEVFFEVYNQLGKAVHREKVQLTKGNNNIPFDARFLSEGIYFYALKNQMGSVSGKMVVLK